MRLLRHSKRFLSDLLVGDGIYLGSDRYTVMNVVRGGMGLVLLLQLESRESPKDFSVHGYRVAIKSVLPERLDEQSTRLFRRELTVWAGLRHPNVVSLEEIFDATDTGWVASMSWFRGSLRDLLLAGAMSLENATAVLWDVIEGLTYAHEKDALLHLDLKPENVLYTADIQRIVDYPEDSQRRYRFSVSDWGIASIKQRELDQIANRSPTDDASIRTFNNMGTIAYMAPERFVEGYRSSVASDMFSLGVLFLEMLTGSLPFKPRQSPVEALLSGAFYANAVRLLQEANVDILMHPLVLSLLSPNPSERVESYDDLKAILSVSYRSATDAAFSIKKAMAGPFDPPTTNRHVHTEFAEWKNSPVIQSAALAAKEKYVAHQADNLKAVGRTAEADACLRMYLNELLSRWEAEAGNASHLKSVANSAIRLGTFDVGRELLLVAIARAWEQGIPLDLTSVYYNLGRICHQLRKGDGEELWCYEMAIAAQTPAGCKFPAEALEKTRAHLFAYSRAKVMDKRKHAHFHRRRLEELEPSVNWDQPEDITAFLTKVQGATKLRGYEG